MYRIEWKKEIAVLAFLGLLLLSPAFLYTHLPDQIPMHWNIQGEVDSYAAKSPISVWLFPFVTAVAYIVMLLVPFVDPKRDRYEKFSAAYRAIRLLFLCFMSLLYVFIIAFSLGYQLPVNKVVPALISLLFIGIGNFMGKLRQNWFVGFKFPWTISDEDVWNKTHRFGGRLMVLAGLIGLLGVLLSPVLTFIFLLVPILVSVTATAIYSYWIYKNKNGMQA